MGVTLSFHFGFSWTSLKYRKIQPSKKKLPINYKPACPYEGMPNTKPWIVIVPIHCFHQAQIQSACDELVMWYHAKMESTADRSFWCTKTSQRGNVFMAQNPILLNRCFFVLETVTYFRWILLVYRSLRRVRNPSIRDLFAILVEHSVVNATFEVILWQFWTCATHANEMREFMFHTGCDNWGNFSRDNKNGELVVDWNWRRLFNIHTIRHETWLYPSYPRGFVRSVSWLILVCRRCLVCD